MVLLDRKGPRVFIITELLSSSPRIQMVFDDTCGMDPPLQAAAWPVCAGVGPSCWNTSSTQLADGRIELRPDSLEKGVAVSLGCCFFGTGSSVWLGGLPLVKGEGGEDSTVNAEDAAACMGDSARGLFRVADLSMVHNKFLIHDIVSISSNTILVLNRHSINTGVWQVTTSRDWAECCPIAVDQQQESRNSSKAARMMMRWSQAMDPTTSVRSADGAVVASLVCGHKRWKGPHGMTLSPDRRSLLVVDTGEEPDGKRGGLICRMRVALDADGKVQVRGVKILDQMSPARADWNPLTGEGEEGDCCDAYKAAGGNDVYEFVGVSKCLCHGIYIQ